MTMCGHVCTAINSGICLGLCASGLDINGYKLEKLLNGRYLLKHRSLNRPIKLLTYNEAQVLKSKIGS